MKLIKKFWNMCGTEKGSCQILCLLITAVTVLQFALDIVPSAFKAIIIVLNAALWFFSFNNTDD